MKPDILESTKITDEDCKALAPNDPMGLLQIAIKNNSAIDVIERLAALQEKMLARDAEMEFNRAMNEVQAEIPRIAPDLNNTQTKSRYASYAALDRVLRPIYTKKGFSLSFDTADCPKADCVRAVCYVSHKAGHTRRYQADMSADGKGAKGGDVMTKTHAGGAAMTYGQRYLLKYIFNVAIGEDDTDGNEARFDELSERVEWIENCRNEAELGDVFEKAYKAARLLNDQKAMQALIAAKDKKRKEFQ